MTDTDTDTDTDADAPPASRFRMWFAFAVFNTIALVALNTELDYDLKDESQENKWCISSMVITLVLAFLGVCAHVLKGKFVGTPMEGGLAFLSLGMWCAVLPAMMRPGNNIAQTRGGLIENANLYFFSWGAFLVSLFIMVAFMHDIHGVGKGLRNKSFKTFAWGGLVVASFVTMVSAIRLYKSANCDDNNDDNFCDRTTFALSIGLVSGLIALIWMILGARLPAIADVVLCCLLLVCWIFAIGYVTFGNDEEVPARNIGNLYFATWASFLITCLLASSGLRAMFGGGDDADEEAKPPEASDEENAAAAASDEENVEPREAAYEENLEPREAADEEAKPQEAADYENAVEEDSPEDEAVETADTGDDKK